MGSEIQLYLNELLVNGTITEVLDSEKKLTLYNVTVRASLISDTSNYVNTSGVLSFYADAIQVGETVYDNQQRPLIQVKDKVVFDAQTAIPTADGRLITRPNPLLKDITYTLEILAIREGDKYYLLGDLPIVVGEPIPIHTKTASLYPVITSVIDVK